MGFGQKMKRIERILGIGEYTIVAKECVELIEHTLRQLFSQYVTQLNEKDQLKVQEAVQKRDRRGEGITGLTLEHLIHVLRESKFLDAWTQVSRKDLSGIQMNDLDKLTQLRNKLIDRGREATRSEAEFLFKFLHIILETFDIIGFENIEEKTDAMESSDESFCFVIMPFEPRLREVYDYGIKLAVESAGLKCIRGDEIPGGGNILGDIVEYIYRAKVIIADLTGDNANVLYELGLAHALDKRVIMIAQTVNGKVDLPFDLANFRVIGYEMEGFASAERLKTHILQHIETLDEWAQRAQNPLKDFLSPDDVPVSADEHKKVKQALEKAERELRDTKIRLEGYEKQEEELRQLRKENARIMNEVLKPFLLGIGGSENMNPDEMLKRFYTQMDKQGQVTVSKIGRDKKGKIIFRKVDTSKKQ